jgi:isopenicillin-N N-acyltransferase like protein
MLTLPQNKIARSVLKTFAIIFLIIGLALGFFLWRIRVPAPEIESNKTVDSYKRVKVAENHYVVGKNWLKKNKHGIWEMYLEGSPYERGLIYGVLAKELMEKQEVNFIGQINEMIPSAMALHIIKAFVGWFNRDIYKYIPDENQQEIYGVSKSFSDKYDYAGPKYYRILNYHAAHDIGHALVDMNVVVGCTSFAVNNALSSDSTLLIARNFDFYVGDGFAEDKLILFLKPDKGYKFASYSWAGLTGVVSGMNEKGLTVTLNAAKSDMPFTAKEPISILARNILQYAGNIQEAVDIAQKSETFVSESLLIGSAADRKAVVIEKSPKKMNVYESGKDYLVCANHYQGPVFKDDSVNIRNIESSDSKARFDRMNQLLQRSFPLDTKEAAGILRDKNALNDQFIGYGNAKSLNQLIAHHGILFKPENKEMWVSTPPYQLGEFIAYDLDNVFAGKATTIDSLEIAKDPFLATSDYKKFEDFKETRHRITRFVMLGTPLDLSSDQEKRFIANNPASYLSYFYLGQYFEAKRKFKKAAAYYEEALKHEVSSPAEAKGIREKIAECRSIKYIAGKS